MSRKVETGNLLCLSDIKNDLLINQKLTVSNQTIMRSLHDSGLCSRVKAMKHRLTTNHVKQRMTFARSHLGWSLDDWKDVIFTDESKFNLYGPDGYNRVWRRSGPAYSDHHYHRMVKFGGGHVMVWGCITYSGVGQLAFIDSTMDAGLFVRVLSTCLESTCRVFDLDIRSIILQQDNDPKHTSKVAREYLQQQGIVSMEWPSCSPDMNIIEHVWNDVDRRLRANYGTLGSKDELKSALQETWYLTPVEYIRALYDSLPRRITSLYRANGKNTKY